MSLYNKVLITLIVSLISVSTAIASTNNNTKKTTTTNNNTSNNSNDAIQGPWMTGPLLAPGGTTIPKGHLNIEPYLFITDDNGIYNNRSKVVSAPAATNISPTMIISYGLTNWMDIAASLPYNFKEKEGQSSSGLGDSNVTLGFQVLRSQPHSWVPDLRLTVEELFPDGRYENLNPDKLGVDAIGAGSYQTSLGANFQKLHQFDNGKYLSTRLTFSYTIPDRAHVRGFNSYGGGIGTDGTVNPGNVFTTDLGLEYTLTQHWVPAMDIVFTTSQKSTFSGKPGTTANGLPSVNNVPSGDEVSLAPAIEYNFSPNFGIIGGTWFSVYGRNSERFTSGVVAVNLFF